MTLVFHQAVPPSDPLHHAVCVLSHALSSSGLLFINGCSARRRRRSENPSVLQWEKMHLLWGKMHLLASGTSSGTHGSLYWVYDESLDWCLGPNGQHHVEVKKNHRAPFFSSSGMHLHSHSFIKRVPAQGPFIKRSLR